MDDPRDDLRVEKPRRIEILTSGGAPHRRPDALKAKIVAESLEPGIMVTELARRHGVRASQIHLWRKHAREGRLALPAPPAFAEVVITPAPSPRRPVAMGLRGLKPSLTVKRNVLRLEPGWRDALKAMELHLDIRKSLMQARAQDVARTLANPTRAPGPKELRLPFGLSF